MLSEMIKAFADVFMMSDRNGNGCGILLYVREDIPAKVIHCDFPTSESHYVEINFRKKKWLSNGFYNQHRNNICNHLDVITKTLDTD